MNYKGFLLLEILLSVTLVIFVITFTYSATLQSEQYSYSLLTNSKAINISKEGIEALINARESNFSQFTDGNYGIYQDGTKWYLSPSPNVIDAFFTRTVNVSSIDSDRKNVSSTVVWKNPFSISNNTVTYNTIITNWQNSSANNNCTNQSSKYLLNKALVSLSPNKKDIINLQIKNNSPSCDLQIKSITLSWIKPGNAVEAISINGGIVWNTSGVGLPTGLQLSGITLDIVDFTIPGNNTFYPIDYIRFNSRIDGSSITVITTFIDNTTASDTFTL